MIKVPHTNVYLPETTVASLNNYRLLCEELYRLAYITNKAYIVPLLYDIGAPIFGTEKLLCKPHKNADGVCFLITHKDGLWKSADSKNDIYFKITTEYSDDIHIETNSYLGMKDLPEAVEEMLIDCLNTVAEAARKSDEKIRNVIATHRGTVASLEFGI